MLNRFEKGQGLVEYALILALIAIVVFVAVALVGNAVRDKFQQLNDSFP